MPTARQISTFIVTPGVFLVLKANRRIGALYLAAVAPVVVWLHRHD